jgi:hypothetical protein
MVLVVLVLGSLMFLSAALMMVTGAKGHEADAALDDARALYLAEAGLAEAVAALEAGATGDVGSPAAPVALGDGVFWADATPQAGGETRVVVTAMAGSGRAAIDVVLEADADPLFQYTLNSKDTLTMNADVTTDSYDSSLGTYASQIASIYNGLSYALDGGDVASNSDIVLNARATIFGDAVPGPGKTVTFATDSYVSGSTTPAAQPFSFPSITVPTIPPSGSYNLGPNSTATLAAGKYDFTTFELQKSATLTIQGPAEIVVDDFTTYNSANLLIDATNGPVTFYVEGTYTHGKNFEADAVPGSPMALAFMIPGTQGITFPSSAKIRGGYYAPNADLLFTNYCEVWGAVAGNRIDMAASMSFHYDEALARYWEDDTGGSNSSPVIAWLPTAVTPTRFATDRRDPYQVLGIAPAAATTPEQGWVW